MQLYGVKAGDILKTLEVAMRLARKRGLKPGERFDKEFFEVAERHEIKHKMRPLYNMNDIKQYVKER